MLENPLASFPGYQLRRASTHLSARLSERLCALDLRIAEASTLMFIGANPGATQSDVGRELNVASSNMAPLIGRLEARGFVARTPVDGRSHGLRLTPAGDEVRSDVLDIMQAHETAILARLPARYRKAFTEALSILSEAAES